MDEKDKPTEAVVLIAKEIATVTPPPEPEAPPQVVDITLTRSKKYIKSLMEGDAFEVMKMLGDQMTTLLLAMNDQMLRWLEVLNDPKSKKNDRGEASFHIAALMNAVAQMAEARIKLQAATGFDKLAQAGMAKPKLYESKEPDMTPERFMEKYKHLMPQNAKPKSSKDAS